MEVEGGSPLNSPRNFDMDLDDAVADSKIEELARDLLGGKINDLPPEILQRIFSQLSDPSESAGKAIKAMYKHLPFVSKNFKENLTDITIQWLNKGIITFNDLECKNFNEALKYINPQSLHLNFVHSIDNLTDKDLQDVSKNCPNLMSLSLLSHDITEDGMVNALTNLKQLHHLYLESCILITEGDKLLTELQNHNDLQHLGLNCLEVSTDKFLEALGKLVQLRSLDLAGCDQISDNKEFLKAIGKLTNLEKLNFAYCDKISFSDELIKTLASLPALKEIDITGCSLISAKTLEELKARLPKIKFLYH